MRARREEPKVLSRSVRVRVEMDGWSVLVEICAIEENRSQTRLKAMLASRQDGRARAWERGLHGGVLGLAAMRAESPDPLNC